MQAKYSLLDQGGVLSFELETANMADVAGLDRLKEWLAQRQAIFLAEAPPPGMDAESVRGSASTIPMMPVEEQPVSDSTSKQTTRRHTVRPAST